MSDYSYIVNKNNGLAMVVMRLALVVQLVSRRRYGRPTTNHTQRGTRMNKTLLVTAISLAFSLNATEVETKTELRLGVGPTRAARAALARATSAIDVLGPERARLVAEAMPELPETDRTPRSHQRGRQ